MKDATEIIPDHLWQSSDPSPELLKEILITCLVLIRLNYGWTGAQAVRYLEFKRPGVLTNELFRKYLMSLNTNYTNDLETPL